MSWADLISFLAHLPSTSAFKKVIDPWGVYLNPTPEVAVSMKLADKIDQLGWIITNTGVPEDRRSPWPLSMHDQLLAEKSRKEKAAPPAAAGEVVDIRTKIQRRRAGTTSEVRKREPNPQAQALRARIAKARDAANQ